VAQRLVRDRSSAQRRHEACPLALFLVTVAEAQGRRWDADRSRCPRLSMTPAGYARRARR